MEESQKREMLKKYISFTKLRRIRQKNEALF